MAGHGMARWGRLGKAGCGAAKAGRGLARQSWQVRVCHGKAVSVWSGSARQGSARLGRARQSRFGRARRGKAHPRRHHSKHLSVTLSVMEWTHTTRPGRYMMDLWTHSA